MKEIKLTKLQIEQIEKLGDKLEAEFGYEIIPVVNFENSKPLQCYSNVEEKIKLDGGKIHYGWSVHFNDGNIIEAERHAVWENDDEELMCVTPNPGKKDYVIFYSDNTPVSPAEQIDNVRMNITINPVINDWIYVLEAIGNVFRYYTERLDTEVVNMSEPVGKVIGDLETERGLIYGVVKSGRGAKGYCYCIEGQNKKRYLHCHSKSLKQRVDQMIEGIVSFKK